MDLEVKSFTVERKKRPVAANEVLLVFPYTHHTQAIGLNSTSMLNIYKFVLN